MVTGYSQIGQFDDALGLLKRMRNEEIELNVVVWSAVIAGYAQRGMGCQALDVFREMMHSGAEPNVVTLVSVLSGCAAVAALRQGKETHCYSIKRILNVDEYDPGEYMMVVNGLIDMYAKCKDRHDLYTARRMFESNKKGVIPNSLTISCALVACARLGALRFVDKFMRMCYGIVMNLQCFLFLIV
ncbi:hypothetical protein Leryth_016410 [Lithospermum erythrorhizon]|nr:hypothetical protein Leryth_016410 [Lithospermum erythrorhizon]